MAHDDDVAQLIRQVRQRLEWLQRSGVKGIPHREPRPTRLAPPARSAPAPAPEPPPYSPPIVVPAPAPAPTPPPRRPAAAAAIAPVKSLFEETEWSGPPLPVPERIGRLEVLASTVAECTRCPILVANRTQTVFGVGDPAARLMFVGEAPGADEDRRGEPFVGRAGQLLTDMITKGMGLSRDDVYIANVIKCRPPENRNPEPDECRNCMPYLEEQIDLIRPQFLCILGGIAAKALLNTALGVGRLRGQWHRYKDIPAVVTWHPAYLLRQPTAKKESWLDLQMLMKAMGLKLPARGE